MQTLPRVLCSSEANAPRPGAAVLTHGVGLLGCGTVGSGVARRLIAIAPGPDPLDRRPRSAQAPRRRLGRLLARCVRRRRRSERSRGRGVHRRPRLGARTRAARDRPRQGRRHREQRPRRDGRPVARGVRGAHRRVAALRSGGRRRDSDRARADRCARRRGRARDRRRVERHDELRARRDGVGRRIRGGARRSAASGLRGVRPAQRRRGSRRRAQARDPRGARVPASCDVAGIRAARHRADHARRRPIRRGTRPATQARGGRAQGGGRHRSRRDAGVRSARSSVRAPARCRKTSSACWVAAAVRSSFRAPVRAATRRRRPSLPTCWPRSTRASACLPTTATISSRVRCARRCSCASPAESVMTE